MRDEACRPCPWSATPSSRRGRAGGGNRRIVGPLHSIRTAWRI